MNPMPGHSVSISMEPLRAGDSSIGSPSASMRPIPPGNNEQAFFRLDLLRSVQLHRRLALGCAVAGLVLGLAYYILMWKVYLAQAVVYVQPAPPTVLQQNGGTPRWPFDTNTYESYIAQQMTNVSRTDVLTAAMHKLGHGSWWGNSETEQSAVDRLRRTIEVTREGTSYQFSIGARSSDPDLAAKLANSVAASYIESAAGEQRAGDTQRLTVLGQERDRIQKELAADRTEQEALNKQLGQAAISATAPDHFDEDIGKLRTELVRARTDHDEAAARYASVGAGKGLSSSALQAEADELISNDAGLVSMKTSLNTRRAVLISQMANLMPTHPQYKQDAEELSKINASLDQMASDLRAKAAARIQLKLRSDLERTAGVEAQLNAQLGQLTSAAGGATSKMQRSSDLVTDIARLQARFTTVDEQWRNLLLEEGAPGSVYLITPAVPPLHTAKSGTLRNSVAIVVLGIMFGLLAAVVLHKLDPKVYVADDVERILGFAPMAQLPDFYDVSDGVAEEHLLRLSAALEYARKQGNLKSCIFTGAGPRTGVTTVVTRVGEMLENLGRSTVFVDATGTAPAPRVTAEGTREIGGHGWAITQRGSRTSALVQQMAEETETQEDSLVLTDTAPLVLSAETEYLARFVDCAIVVVESGVTTRTQLRDAATTLQRLDVAAVGFVLNRIGLKNADPPFRHSVRAIEDHLNAQNASEARRTAKNQPSAFEYSAAYKEIPEKTGENGRARAAEAQRPTESPRAAGESRPSELRGHTTSPPPVELAQPSVGVQPIELPSPVEFTSAAAESQQAESSENVELPRPAAPTPISQVPTWPPQLAPHEQPDVPAEPAHASLQASGKLQIPEMTQPLQSSASDDPWWLADMLRKDEPHQPEAQPESVMAGDPPIEGVLQSPEVQACPIADVPELGQVPEPPPIVVAPQPLHVGPGPDPDIEPQPVAQQPPAQGAAHLSQSWDSEPQGEAADESESTEQEAQHAESKRSLSALSSRFDGLRNLVTILGLRQMQTTPVQRHPAPKSPANANHGKDLAILERALTAAKEPVPSSADSASPKLVTAQPEFLPPKPAGESNGTDRSGEDRASHRRDRWDEGDEVAILPSRRGQYKRR